MSGMYWLDLNGSNEPYALCGIWQWRLWVWTSANPNKSKPEAWEACQWVAMTLLSQWHHYVSRRITLWFMPVVWCKCSSFSSHEGKAIAGASLVRWPNCKMHRLWWEGTTEPCSSNIFFWVISACHSGFSASQPFIDVSRDMPTSMKSLLCCFPLIFSVSSIKLESQRRHTLQRNILSFQSLPEGDHVRKKSPLANQPCSQSFINTSHHFGNYLLSLTLFLESA